MRTRIAAIASLLAVVLASCGGDTTSPAASQAEASRAPESSASTAPVPAGDGETLTIALASLETEQFDPHIASQTTKIYQSLMYDWLVGVTPEGEFDSESGVASDWEFSEDGLTWTATIREGITFWDGSPLTAEDAAFSLQRVISDEGSSSGASTLRDAIASVEASDATQLVVELNNPFLFLPHLLSRLGATDGAIISKAYFEEAGAEGFAAEPLGSGPYRLVEHVSGSSFRFEAVPNHWRVGTPTIGEIIMLGVPEEQTRSAMLQRGEAQIVASSRQGAQEAADAGFNVLSKPDNANIHLNFHEQWREDNPMADIRVREAMNIAINRQEILDELLYGLGELRGIGHLGSAHIGWDESIVPPYPYDPDRARELLDESGYLDSPTQIDVYSYERAEASEIPDIMEAVVGYWQAVGLNVRLIPSDYGAVREQWGAFELGNAVSVLGTTNRVVFPVQLVWGSEGDLSYVHDEELDGLISAWNTAATVEEAEDAIQAVMTYVHENHISTPIVSVGSEYSASPEIEAWPGLDGLLSGEIYLDGLFASQ